MTNRLSISMKATNNNPVTCYDAQTVQKFIQGNKISAVPNLQSKQLVTIPHH